MKYGIKLLGEQAGDGSIVERHKSYLIRLRIWLSRGDPVRWERPWGGAHAHLEEDGATLVTDVRMDRVNLIPGLFYGMEGMRIGGTRKIRIPPSFGFGKRGIPDRIPPDAVLTAELSVLAHGNEASTDNAER